jgi:DNA-binding SARP family transcriptional activator/predicted ATPase
LSGCSETREVTTDLLNIHLLGSFQVTQAEKPLAGFESNKVRALLAYLTVESDRPHQRRKLAALLWPEFPESTALSNLRYALSNLRKVIGDRFVLPAYLEINPQTIEFNLTSSCRIDVSVFEGYCALSHQNPLDFHSLEQAADLYHGSFLEGFSIPDSIAFEEWVLLKREHLDRLAIQVFYLLADNYELAGDYQQAISYAERQLELDPWREEAHRRLMRCLYFTGQRNPAMAQYEACRQALAAELALEPDQETRQLYEQIRKDKLSAPPVPPAFLRRLPSIPVEGTRFVSRQDALNRLHIVLNRAMAGNGQLLMVTGSPGQGKTALVQEFLHQALETHPALAAAWGNSHAYFGSGDPYLPFREILEMLTGQVEHRWEAGSITQEHARRMWRLTAYSAPALVQEGPALIGTFVGGLHLLQRASMVVQSEPSWLTRLRAMVDRQALGPPSSQEDLFQQYWRVLVAIARQVPLLLFLDDLQWADQSSLALLFHLSRELKSARILILAAFRPVEEVPYSGAGPPSLATMINELRLMHGDILINLDELEERSFIDAYLDLEPNRFEATFREDLFRYTHSHPLFTVEMLYGMQERGDVIKNQQGEWVVSPSLDWNCLPPRVEAAIADRLRQLPQSFLNLLQTASIEGERFTAEVAAKVQGVDEQQVLILLSTDLDHRYKLVQAESSRSIKGSRLSRYRFRHILFQRYLYSQLDVVERARLHEQVGNTMEEQYSSIMEENAVQLAYHFELAGIPLKAIHYLHLAGRHATHLASFEDAILHLNKALFLLERQPGTVDKDLLELELLTSLNAPLMLARGYASPDLGVVCNRSVQLLNNIPQKPDLFPILFLLAAYYLMRAEYQKSLAQVPQGIRIAESSGDDLLIHMMNWICGCNLLWLGELSEALSKFDKMIDFYDPLKHSEVHHFYGSDPGIACLTWSSWTLWLLGYPEKALKRCQQAIDLGQRLDDPDCQLFTQLTAFLHLLMRDPEGAFDLMQSCSLLLAQHSLPLFSAEDEFYRGLYQVQVGGIETGLASMSSGVETYQAIGTRNMLSMHFTLQAEAFLRSGQVEQTSIMLQQTEKFIEETGERFYQAETLRVKGEMLLLQSSKNEEDAEDCFCHALQVAHEQEAKTLELRAAINLARLWQSQGHLAEAHQVLAEVYNWFTEGFATPDLKEAQALLETFLHSDKFM